MFILSKRECFTILQQSQDSSRNAPFLYRAWGDDPAADLRSGLHLLILLYFWTDAFESRCYWIYDHSIISNGSFNYSQQSRSWASPSGARHLSDNWDLERHAHCCGTFITVGRCQCNSSQRVAIMSLLPCLTLLLCPPKHQTFRSLSMGFTETTWKSFSQAIKIITQAPQSELIMIDILHQASGEKTLFVHPRIKFSSTHGTSRCTLSSAIACEIAILVVNVS